MHVCSVYCTNTGRRNIKITTGHGAPHVHNTNACVFEHLSSTRNPIHCSTTYGHESTSRLVTPDSPTVPNYEELSIQMFAGETVFNNTNPKYRPQRGVVNSSSHDPISMFTDQEPSGVSSVSIAH